MRGAFAAFLAVLAPTAVNAQTTAMSATLPVAPALMASIASATPARGRVVLVDAASASLFMMQDGQVVDSMRVIVGRAGATPTLKGTLHYATLNPYWYVPPDLAARIIAPNVLKDGAYLAKHGYEVVSAFNAQATLLSSEDVDWRKVAAGEATVFVRQRPGPTNSMGRMKFGFGNVAGIYLHDTPKKELFAQDKRDLSNGCVRLEDAPRLARWLLGQDPQSAQDSPEQHVALPGPVSIVITYLDRPAHTEMAALR
jgi:murein L,D-transpeptidase YcbB/YkuD